MHGADRARARTDWQRAPCREPRIGTDVGVSWHTPSGGQTPTCKHRQLGIFLDGKASAYLGVFGFELSQAVAQRANRVADLLLGEARRDVLLAIPIERFQTQPEDAFELGVVIWHGDERSQVGVIARREGLGVGVDLEPCPMRVVHEEQTGSVVRREVAGADVLAVTAIIGKGECSIIDQLEEAARTASMLDVRPSRL